MKKILKPTLKVSEVFADCIDTYSNQDLKRALIDAIPMLEEAEFDFEQKKQKNELFLIPQNIAVSDIVNSTTLKNVYTNKMVKKDNPKGRAHYDTIFLSAPKGICPLCSQRTVGTLDHYLPKALYPLLSVTPINLIPSCIDCNKGKLVDFPKKSQDETLHPYYDDVEGFSWLKMTVVKIKPFVVKFYTNPPGSIQILLAKRIKTHFDNFELNKLYVVHAAQEFENKKIYFERLYKRGGSVVLQEHLTDEFESRSSVNKNSWQTAFYEGLLGCAEFCNGEFF